MKKQTSSMPLLHREDGSKCQNEEEGIRELMNTKCPKSTGNNIAPLEQGAQAPAPSIYDEEVGEILQKISPTL